MAGQVPRALRPPARTSAFLDFVVEQMASIGGLHTRAMFGGYGVYRDELFFAIVIDDRLYFKADPVTRGEFEARGLAPFTYGARGKFVSLQYYEAPPEVFEDAEAMRDWAQKALGAALRAGKAATPRNMARRARTKRRAAEG